MDQSLADAWRDGTVLVDPPRLGLDADTLPWRVSGLSCT